MRSPCSNSPRRSPNEVLQAISVRRHPDRENRWILNFGARRLRASKLAGRSQIPAFVNETANSYDQVIENEQREGLKPLELALFIQRRLASGESQTDIARKMGKGRAYVTYAMALIDAPDWLMSAYREGRCRGLRELYELRRLHDVGPEVVEEWLIGAGTVTRADLQTLKEGLQPADPTSPPPASTPAVPTTPASQPPDAVAAPSSCDDATVPVSTAVTKRASSVEGVRIALASSATANQRRGSAAHGRLATLWGTYGGADVVIDLSGVPEEDGRVFVLRQCDGERLAVQASLVQLRRVAPGSV
jgi:ParB family chromosome partitioning protein